MVYALCAVSVLRHESCSSPRSNENASNEMEVAVETKEQVAAPISRKSDEAEIRGIIDAIAHAVRTW